MAEFNQAMHSGSAPRDLRHVDTKPAPVTDAPDVVRALLTTHGHDELAPMLFDPISERRPASHKSRAERAHRLQQVAVDALIRDVMAVG